MTPASPEDPTPAQTTATAASAAADETNHPDPITGEPGAHPVGVGIGAASAGLAGAVVGAIAGPVGMLIGAAIGAVAGGLAGKEVAADDDEPLRDGDSIVSTDAPTDAAGSMAVLPGTGMPGMFNEGFPAAALTTAPGTNSFGRETEAAPEADVAGSRIGGSNLPFHDAFTATTLEETEAENRIVGDDDTNADLTPETEAPISSLTPSEGGSALTETVRSTAYYRYLHRQSSGEDGNAFEDWLSAENEVLRG